MPTATMPNLSGPTVRKTMDSVRRASHDDVETNGRTCYGTSKKVQKNASYNVERSVNNSTLSFGDGDDLIDSDNSVSDNCTEDDEPLTRESTPNPLLVESAGTNGSDAHFQLHGLSMEKDKEPGNTSATRTTKRRTPLRQEKDTGHRNLSAASTTKRRTPLKQVTTPVTTPVKPNEPKRLPIEKDGENGNKYLPCTFVIGLVLSVFLYRMYYVKPPAKAVEKTCEKFYSLEESYKNIDDSLWDSLLVSFVRANAVQKHREPGTFLFLHNGSTKMVDRFIEQVTKITADCFGGTHPIVLGSNYFKRTAIEQDFGEFLSQQTDALREQGIMVVRNLEDVPPNAAQAFHSICDPEEPLVDKAVIYFTMDTSKIAGNVVQPVQSATADAERLLNQLWKHVLKPEVLDPLVTRLTENVYRIV